MWKYSGCSLRYTSFKTDLTEYKYLYCNKNYKEKFNEKLKKQLFNTYTFSIHDNNKLYRRN